jgi:SAM-dependent methyltransferase
MIRQDQENKIINCLICGSAADLKFKGYPGYKQPAKFDIYNCYGCNTSFSFPTIDAADIYEDIYRNGKFVPGYKRYWRYMELVKDLKDPLEFLAHSEDMYWSVKEALSYYPKEKSSIHILEIGSGLGYLTYSLLKSGYNVKGLDISETAVKQAVKNFGDHFICADLFDYASNNAGKYDMVILTEVIEHIVNPLAFIDAIKRILKTGGISIITTPNKSFFPSDIIWGTENPPVHVWWFSEDSIRYMANRNDLRIDFIDFSNFYKKNNITHDLNEYRNIPFIPSILDQNGNLIRKSSPFSLALWYFLFKVPRLQKLLHKIKLSVLKEKDSKTSEVISSNSRGYVMCAILTK